MDDFTRHRLNALGLAEIVESSHEAFQELLAAEEAWIKSPPEEREEASRLVKEARRKYHLRLGLPYED